jgi:CHRD domain
MFSRHRCFDRVIAAAPVSFAVTLEGAQQVPPVETAGIGTANLTYDPERRLITWSLTCDSLSGPAMMGHFQVRPRRAETVHR